MSGVAALVSGGVALVSGGVMGVLLDSSWKFGPAERDSLEWSPGPPPPTERLPVSTAPLP